MLTGDEKCSDCKRTPFPQGWCERLRLCWFCGNPRGLVELTEAQKKLVKESWNREALA